MSSLFFDPPVFRVSPPVATNSDAPPSRAYRVHSEETWIEARFDYSRGVPAPEVCARYDIGLSALRTRARTEGWRRSDLAEDEVSAPPEPELDEALPLIELADLAWRSVSHAMRRGKVYEARAWMRLTEDLRAQIKSEMAEVLHREGLPARNAERAAKNLPPIAAALHPLHPISTVQSEPRAPLQATERMQADDARFDEPAAPAQPPLDPAHVPTRRERIAEHFPNLKHLWGDTAPRDQNGEGAEADEGRKSRHPAAPNAHDYGGAPCGPE